MTAYKESKEKAAAVVGHDGLPPPVADVIDEGAENTTRWKAVSVPTAADTRFAESDVTAVPEAAVVTKKEFAAGARAYKEEAAREAASTGHDAVGVTPDPVTAVGAGAEKVTTCPAKRVPTAADTTLLDMPVTATAAGKVDTIKLPKVGAAAYRAAPAIAAALAGHATVPPPVSARVVPLCGVKRSSVPGARVPTDADIALPATPEMVTPDTPAPTTQ